MNLNKVAVNDELLDNVSGGSVIPHRVLPGESLESIANRYKIDKKLLAQWNHIDENAILDANTTVLYIYR